jgi:hypothetical protein
MKFHIIIGSTIDDVKGVSTKKEAIVLAGSAFLAVCF